MIIEKLILKTFAYVCRDCLHIGFYQDFKKHKCPLCKSKKIKSLYLEHRLWEKINDGKRTEE